MKEEWKLVKEYKTLSTLHIPGDKIYVSNTGKVKMNDTELTLEFGLHLDSNGEKTTYGVDFGDKLYRVIYRLFVGELHRDYWHNVHHIDGNHYNDSVDNLIEVTVYQHGNIHKEEDLNWGYEREHTTRDYYMSIADEMQEQTRQWLVERVNKYKQQRAELNTLLIELQKQQTKTKELQKEINKTKGLFTGEYYINENGMLRAKHQHRTKTYNNMTPEGLERKREATRRQWQDPEYRAKYLQNALNNLTKGRSNMEGAKLVMGDDGKRHWSKPKRGL